MKKSLFDLGLLGYFDEYANRTYMQCGCIWDGMDHHYVIKTCPYSPHPSARTVRGPQSRNNAGYSVQALVDRSRGDYINKLLKLRPVIDKLHSRMQGDTKRLSPFIMDLLRYWIRGTYNLKEADVIEALRIYREERKQHTKGDYSLQEFITTHPEITQPVNEAALDDAAVVDEAEDDDDDDIEEEEI